MNVHLLSPFGNLENSSFVNCLQATADENIMSFIVNDIERL